MLLPCYEFDELSLDVGSYNAPSENGSDEDVKYRINYWGYALKIHIICPLNHLMPQMSDIQMLSLKSL